MPKSSTKISLPSNTRISLPAENFEVLRVIKHHGPINMVTLLEKVGLDRGKLEGIVALLNEQNLVDRESTITKSYELSNRGKIAASGLAERILIDQLIDQNQTMTDLQNNSKLNKGDLTAGIGKLRKAGLILIDKGVVSLTDQNKAKSFSKDIEIALKEIDNGSTSSLGTSLEKELIARGFIEILESTDVIISTKISDGQMAELGVKEEITRLSPRLISSGEWKKVTLKPYSLSTKPRTLYAGRLNPYKHFLDHLRIKLIGLGFQEMRGPLVEQEFWNFDALYAPQDHASREDSDILLVKTPSHGKLVKSKYVKNVQKTHEDGWQTGSRGHRYIWKPEKAARLLLRPQGTSVSARTLPTIKKPPAKFFSIARNFRPDQIDSTHDIEFDQTEGIICDPRITFRDLLGMLRTFAVEVAGATDVQFRPDYYPFTSPSVELSARHPVLGRVEFGGAGIFRPEVTQPFGIDYPVLAWGLGVGRLFMTKNKVTDIRELFSQDLDWLRKQSVSSGISLEGES